MNTKTIEYLQHRTAQLAIGPSTLRNQGAPGVVAKAREFLGRVKLERFSVDSRESFRHVLDQETASLRDAFPAGAQNWGAARKALNIFLRDCAYNRFFCRHFKLGQVHPWLEMPLDNFAARALRHTSIGVNLPRWETIKRLKPEQNAKYQEVTSRIAKRIGCERVDVDLYLWRKVGIKDVEKL